MRRIVCAVIFLAAWCASAQADVIRGAVVEIRKDCAVDGKCSLSVKADNGQTTEIVLNEGEQMPSCDINQKAAAVERELKAGQKVEVNVSDQFKHKRAEQTFYYLCGADSSITILP